MTVTTAELVSRWETLLPTANAVAREAQMLRNVVRRLSSPEGYEALKRLDRDLERVEAAKFEVADIRARALALSQDVRGWLALEWERRATVVRDELVAWFADRGVPVEAGEDGDLVHFPVAIQIDPRHDRAALLHAGEVVKASVPLAPDRVFREWQKVREQLERQATDPDRFAQVLDEAYRAIPGDGSRRRVRLPDVHFSAFVHRQTRQVKNDPRRGRVKEYPRYQFAWDLGRFVEDGGPERAGIDLLEASRTAGDSRSASVRVDWAAGGSTRYGDMRAG